MKIKNLGPAIPLTLSNGDTLFLPTGNTVHVPDNTFLNHSDKALLLAQNVTITADDNGAFVFPDTPAPSEVLEPVMARRNLLTGRIKKLTAAGQDLVDTADTGVSNRMLSAMGYNGADIAATPLALKDCAPWLVTMRALDKDRIDNPTNGISGVKYARDFHGLVGENVHKWITVEAVQNTLDWSRADALESQLPQTPIRRAMHCIFGQNGYNPAWVATALGADATQAGPLLTKRINDLKAKYPADQWYRIDVVNEVFSDSTPTSYATDRGFRTTNNAFYTAGLANYPANPMQHVWDAFTACRTAWPSAKLCWNDYGLEVVHPCDSYNRGKLPYFWDTLAKSGSTITPTSRNAFLTNNDRAATVQKLARAKYEIWKAKAAGIPVDVIGYQLHVDVVAPPNFDDLVASFGDWNRWGVLPAITEFNARNTYANSSVATVLPPHLQRSGADDVNRYGAYIAHGYLKQFLTHTPCEEVTFWSPAFDQNGDAQTSTQLDVDYPIRTATMLAIKNAAAPADRTIKRGSRISGRFALPMCVTNSAGGGTNISHTGNRASLTGPASLKIDWKWFNDAWMARPIAANDLILDAQFQIAASIAADTVLMGYGNATSGTPTNVAYLILNGTTLRLDIVVGGVTVLTQNVATGISTAQDHRVAVRINGTDIKYTFDGGAVGTATASGSFSDQTAVYLLSKPDASAYNSNLSVYFWEVQHGPDYNTDGLLKTLSTNLIRDVSLEAYLGD